MFEFTGFSKKLPIEIPHTMTITYHRHCPVSDSYDIPMSIVRRAIFSLSRRLPMLACKWELICAGLAPRYCRFSTDQDQHQSRCPALNYQLVDVLCPITYLSLAIHRALIHSRSAKLCLDQPRGIRTTGHLWNLCSQSSILDPGRRGLNRYVRITTDYGSDSL